MNSNGNHSPLIGELLIDGNSFILLKAWYEAGDRAAVYQNHDLGSRMIGHTKFLRIGPRCTFQEPPWSMPNEWRYVFVGFLEEHRKDFQPVKEE